MRSKLLPNSEVVFGKDVDDDGNYVDPLNIVVQGVKKVSSLQDSGVVDISNLTYETILKLIYGKYFIISIWIGYKGGELFKVFEGEVAGITQTIQQNKDYTAHIIYASQFVAAYSQSRINFNCNSMINLSSAYKALLRACDIKDAGGNGIDADLKDKVLPQIISEYANPKELSDMLSEIGGGLDVSADSSVYGNILTVLEGGKNRWLRISPNTISFTNGNPTVSADGLRISLLPTFNFAIGDVIIIDNAIVDISETSLSGVQKNFNANYLDRSMNRSVNSDGTNSTEGAYLIKEIEYSFENRGSTFKFDILARPMSIVDNLIGE